MFTDLWARSLAWAMPETQPVAESSTRYRLAMTGRDLLYRAGKLLEVVGLMIPIAAICYALTAEDGAPVLTVEFLGVGAGLLIFYLGRNLVSRSMFSR
jgi:hypothetical protein